MHCKIFALQDTQPISAAVGDAEDDPKIVTPQRAPAVSSLLRPRHGAHKIRCNIRALTDCKLLLAEPASESVRESERSRLGDLKGAITQREKKKGYGSKVMEPTIRT
jgi:hypothetical protein